MVTKMRQITPCTGIAPVITLCPSREITSPPTPYDPVADGSEITLGGADIGLYVCATVVAVWPLATASQRARPRVKAELSCG